MSVTFFFFKKRTDISTYPKLSAIKLVLHYTHKTFSNIKCEKTFKLAFTTFLGTYGTTEYTIWQFRKKEMKKKI